MKAAEAARNYKDAAAAIMKYLETITDEAGLYNHHNSHFMNTLNYGKRKVSSGTTNAPRKRRVDSALRNVDTPQMENVCDAAPQTARPQGRQLAGRLNRFRQSPASTMAGQLRNYHEYNSGYTTPSILGETNGNGSGPDIQVPDAERMTLAETMSIPPILETLPSLEMPSVPSIDPYLESSSNLLEVSNHRTPQDIFGTSTNSNTTPLPPYLPVNEPEGVIPESCHLSLESANQENAGKSVPTDRTSASSDLSTPPDDTSFFSELPFDDAIIHGRESPPNTGLETLQQQHVESATPGVAMSQQSKTLVPKLQVPHINFDTLCPDSQDVARFLAFVGSPFPAPCLFNRPRFWGDNGSIEEGKEFAVRCLRNPLAIRRLVDNLIRHGIVVESTINSLHHYHIDPRLKAYIVERTSNPQGWKEEVIWTVAHHFPQESQLEPML